MNFLIKEKIGVKTITGMAGRIKAQRRVEEKDEERKSNSAANTKGKL